MPSLQTLPTELILAITSHLTVESTAAFLGVCPTFLNVLGHDYIYRKAIVTGDCLALDSSCLYEFDTLPSIAIYFKRAVLSGNIRAVTGLIDAGGDPTVRYPNNDFNYRDVKRNTQTLLHFCAWRSNTAMIVPLLVDAGVDPYYDPKNDIDVPCPQSSPAALAMKKGHFEVVRALLKCMRDPRFELQGVSYEKDAWGDAWHNVNSGEGVRLCLEKTIEPGPTPTSQATLDAAFRRATGVFPTFIPENISVADALLKAGAQPSGETVFAAVDHLRLDLVRLQLEHSSSVTPDHVQLTSCSLYSPTGLPKSPLLVALRRAVTWRPPAEDYAAESEREYVERLYEAIRIDYEEKAAAKAGPIVNLLLQHGANVDLSISLLDAVNASLKDQYYYCRDSESPEDVRIMMGYLERFRIGEDLETARASQGIEAVIPRPLCLAFR